MVGEVTEKLGGHADSIISQGGVRCMCVGVCMYLGVYYVRCTAGEHDVMRETSGAREEKREKEREEGGVQRPRLEESRNGK